MELTYILWMSMLKRMNAKKMTALIDKFGSAEAVYQNRSLAKYACGDIIDKFVAQELLESKSLEEAKRVCDYVYRRQIGVLTLWDEDYPSLLREIDNPPALLYYKGINIFKHKMPSIAIVGARKSSPYGLSCANGIAGELAAAGINIVSGMALGIDAAAHGGALSVGGSTAAVFGCGIDVVYPAANRHLYERIQNEDGMLLSEFLPETPALSKNFPRRNRIISGLCEGTLVVEAAMHSGSLITASYAAEQGRDVFAVPGNITQSASEGCNQLIRDGARLVSKTADILEDMLPSFRAAVGGKKSTKEEPKLEAHESEILGLIRGGLQSCDALAKQLHKPAAQILGILSVLELNELIVNDMGKLYAIC